MLWTVLLRFLFRLNLGIAVSMALTSSRQVGSGFFRVHLWVLLGLNTFAALISTSHGSSIPHSRLVVLLAISGALASYAGSVCWLYDRMHGGRLALLLVAICAVLANVVVITWPNSTGMMTVAIGLLDILTSSLILGACVCAMFLGHWYLNTPSMRLEPLKGLLWLMLAGIVARVIVCGFGLGLSVVEQGWPAGMAMATLALRWGIGLVGIFVVTIMVYKTLEIPNTQSATGLLYVGVIFVFLGELSSQLLSFGSWYLV